jgi:EAL domain-containing protein (putative c-di-GMP-specific phosphodiesterase class I)
MLLGTASPAPSARRVPPRKDHRQLRTEIRRGLQRGEFAVVYQPRIDLCTATVRGCEALLRWPGRPRGVLSPSVFIPVAEGSELISQLGGWVLAQACTEALLWGGRQVSVNVSSRQLASGVLPQQVAQALQRSGLAPERLELELTESMLIECGTETLLTLSALRDLGVGLALDDFGTGWASIAMLKRLPLTTLKLDRSMIRELPGNREDAAIVRAMVGTGHALGLTVVAEGIETELQRAYLASLGCDEGQGFLFSHPLSPELVWPFAVYRDDTCSAGRSTPETPNERSPAH